MFDWKILLFLVSFVGTEAYSQETKTNPFEFKWDNGFKLNSADSIFSLQLGGYLFIDQAYLHQDTKFTESFGPLESSSSGEIRSARLFFSGNIYENINFKFQVDFAGEKVRIKDMYIGVSKIPGIGNFRIGHFNEPIRLSALTSSKYLTFMERGPNSYFSPTRNYGAMIFNDFLDNRLSGQFGVFRNAIKDSSTLMDNRGYAATGRITGIPYRDLAKNKLLHMGAAYSYREPGNNIYKIAISPGSHFAEKYLDIGDLEFVNNVNLLNFETAYIHGPFLFQTEYLTASINTVESTFTFSSYYAEFSYLITGENQNYKSSYQGFGRIKPRRNFGGNQKGFGALEVALRLSHTDLHNKVILTGKQQGLAVGLNWYLNPVTRVMVNYIRTEIEDKGNLNVLQARFQIDF